MKPFVLLVMLFFISGCSKDQQLAYDIKFNGKEHLEKIDSSSGGQCLVLRRNTLYDSSEGLKFKVKIVHILNEEPFYSLSPYLGDDERLIKMDTSIIDSLNSMFRPYKIGFGIFKHEEFYSGELFDDMARDFYKWEEYGVLTLVIFHTDGGDNYGVVFNTPSNICGMIASRVMKRTVAHEFGHLFGLLHVHEPDPTNGKNPYYGDKNCDTPSINVMDWKIDDKCRYQGPPKYTEEELKMLIPNYMLHYNDPCRHSFTPLQVLTMRWYIQETPILNAALY